jgi:hypothetical protein
MLRAAGAVRRKLNAALQQSGHGIATLDALAVAELRIVDQRFGERRQGQDLDHFMSRHAFQLRIGGDTECRQNAKNWQREQYTDGDQGSLGRCVP